MPVISNQRNLIELSNTFLDADRYKKYARLFVFAARYYGHSELLERDSVKKKLLHAKSAKQASKNAPATEAIKILFPDLLKAATSNS